MQGIETKILESGVMVLAIDQENSSANILNAKFFEELNKALDKIEKNKTLKGLIFSTKKKNIFLAGADLVSMQSNIDDITWLDEVITIGQETFNRIENSRNRQTGGTGLGLSIANNSILAHGGELFLEDSPLGGLRVRLLLPL